MDYAALKLAHVSCAAVSYTLFVVRGFWMIRGSMLLQQRWVKIVPHVVDTILLTSAIAMVVISRQYPLVMRWLDAKIIALAIYVALGMIALKLWQHDAYSYQHVAGRSTRVCLHRRGRDDTQSNALDRLSL